MGIVATLPVFSFAQESPAIRPDSAQAPFKTYYNPEAFLFRNRDTVAPIASFLFSLPTFKKVPWLGLTGIVYSQRNESWGEAMIGPSFKFKNKSGEWAGGVMLGFETKFPGLRTGPWFNYANPKQTFQVSYYYEIQPTGIYPDPSMRGELLCQVYSTDTTDKTVKYRIGLRQHEKNVGFEISIKKAKTYVFGSVLDHWQDGTIAYIFGVGAEFE